MIPTRVFGPIAVNARWGTVVCIYTTRRTCVERITLDHAAFFVELLNTPDWLEHIGDRNVRTVEDARRYLERGFLRLYEDHGFGYYLVSNHSRVPIGIVGFMKKPHLENADLGFALLPRYHGRGLGYESAKAMLRWGTDAFGLSTVDAEVKSRNVRSIGLLKKLQFQPVAGPDEPLSDTLVYRWDRGSQETLEQT